MYCSQCGKEISENAKFCQYCGNKVEGTISPNSSYTSPYAYVPDNNSNSQYRQSAPSPSYTRVQKKQSFPWAMVAIIFVVLVIIIVIADSVSDATVNSNLTPVSEPRSGTILSGVECFTGSEITVSASNSESCVVKLKTSSEVEVMSFYVRAGETVTVGVPDEYLYVLFASGEVWYGNDHLFGENTSYSKDDEICNFVDYTWEYTLYPVNSGNFSQTPIDEDEFR